ncbi:MAG TPA: hypothetical protein VJ732_16375 [Bryobacteraceae bacterium]|nr:hypothetical protein [Bryobacteraceae bacterium]
MKKTLIASIAAMFLGILTVGYAQDHPRQPDQGQQERNREASVVTIRGCLAKGSQPQQYMVADETSGENVTFSGPARLDDYVNQTVELTGQYVDDGGQRTFQPRSMKAVSGSCKTRGQ